MMPVPWVRRLAAGLCITVLLGIFWASVWQGMDQSVLSRVPILDEAHYLQRAVEIRDQGWVPEQAFTMSPLYSYLVALTGSGRLLADDQTRAGGPPYGIRILQALLWFGVAWLLWLVGSNLYGRRWGWGPPLLWLGYGPAAILAGQVLMEIPLVFVTTLTLAVSGGHIGPSSSRGRAWLTGTLLGLALLLRGTAVVLVVPALMALVPDCFRHIRLARRSCLQAGLPLIAALVLVVMPFAILNSVRAGKPAAPALNGGVNLYIGNGPGADGFYRAFPGFDIENDPSGAAYLGERTGHRVPDALTADQIWSAKARQSMAADPLRTLRLWGRKVWLHFVGIEIPQVSAFSAWRRSVPLLRALLVPWVLLAVTGLAGGFLAWRRQTALRPWLVAALLLVAVQSLFFVVTRYRLILVPSLALASIALAKELMVRRGRQLLIALGVVLLAVAFVWPWGLSRQISRLKAGGLNNEAVRWEHVATATVGSNAEVATDDLAEAQTLYQRSLTLVDNQPDAWRGLGRIFWAQGQSSRAIATLSDGLSQVTNAKGLRRDLIGMLMLQRRTAEAAAYLVEALRSEPDDPDLLRNMVVAQVKLGQMEQAIVTARKLVGAHPDDPGAYVILGKVLGQARRLPESESAFGDGLRLSPHDVELRRGLDHVRELLATEQK